LSEPLNLRVLLSDVTAVACGLRSLCSVLEWSRAATVVPGAQRSAPASRSARSSRERPGAASRRANGERHGRGAGKRCHHCWSTSRACEGWEPMHALEGAAARKESGARVAGCHVREHCRASAPSRASSVERAGMDCHPGGHHSPHGNRRSTSTAIAATTRCAGAGASRALRHRLTPVASAEAPVWQSDLVSSVDGPARHAPACKTLCPRREVGMQTLRPAQLSHCGVCCGSQTWSMATSPGMPRHVRRCGSCKSGRTL